MTGIRNELLEALKKRVERRRREKEKAKAKKAQRRGQQTISPVQKKSEESESRSGNGSGGAMFWIGIARRIGEGVFATVISASHCVSLIDSTGVPTALEFASSASWTLET